MKEDGREERRRRRESHKLSPVLGEGRGIDLNAK